MTGLHTHQVLRGAGRETADLVTLGYADRFLRRKRLTTEGGTSFLVDLPETTSLYEGDAFALSDGTLIGVRAAPEPLLEVTGEGLPRLAWHIGNRHTPCQIEPARLLIAQDHVLAGMLTGLGATLRDVTEPFLPEGGAYGHGRTMGHDHGPEAAHAHEHSHETGHRHVHVHVSRAPGDDPDDVPLDV